MRSTLFLAISAVFLAATSDAAWYLRLSEKHCEAVYQFQTGYVRLYENVETRRFRAAMHPDAESHMPMLEFGLHTSYHGRRGWEFIHEWQDEDRPAGTDNMHGYGWPVEPYLQGSDLPGTVTAEARLFPDDGQGFFPVELYAEEYGHRYLWTGFDLHDRLKRWGTAKETKDDPGVRLPEVRLIFRWTSTGRRPYDVFRLYLSDLAEPADIEHYLDIPLWRTSNAMNKLKRCGDALSPAS